MELTIDNKLIASIKSKKKLTIQKGEAHMNQIIYDMHRKNRKTANSTFFKFFFSFCIITLVFFIFWFLYKFYKTGQNDVISQKEMNDVLNVKLTYYGKKENLNLSTSAFTNFEPKEQ